MFTVQRFNLSGCPFLYFKEPGVFGKERVGFGNERKSFISSKLFEIKVEIPTFKYYLSSMKRFNTLIALFLIVCTTKLFAQSEKELLKISEYDSIAFHFENIPNYDSAIVYYKKELEIYKQAKNDKEIGRTYLKIGRMLSEKGEIAEASDVFFKVLTYAEKSNDTIRIAIAHTRIGRCYEFLEQPDKAIEQYKKGLEISEKFSIHKQMIALYGTLGNMYLQQSKTDECKTLVLRADSVAKILNNPYFTYGSNNLAGLYYLAIEDYLQAEKYMKLALDYNLEKNPNTSHTAGTYFNLGDIYARQKKTSQAISSYEKAYAIFSQQNEKKNMMDLANNLSELYATIGDYKKAYEFRKMYDAYSDSIINIETQMAIAELQTKYDVEKKDAQLKLLDKENKLIAQEKKLKEQKADEAERNFYYTLGISILLLITIIIVIWFFISRQKINKKLSEQEIRITRLQTQMNPHLIFNALVSIQEMILTGDKMKSVDSVSKFSKLMRSTLNHSDKEFISLDQEKEFLETYASFENDRNQGSIQFTISIDGDLEKTGAMVPPLLVQPLVENAFKHAFKTSIEHPAILVEMKKNNAEKYLEIHVSDNGSGMNATASSESKALTILKNRLTMIWSKSRQKINKEYFEVRNSNPGTHILIRLPFIEE